MVNTKRSLAKLICLLCGVVGVTAINLSAYSVSQEYALSAGGNLLSSKSYVLILAFACAAVAVLLGRILNRILSGVMYAAALAVIVMGVLGVVLTPVSKHLIQIPGTRYFLYTRILPLCMLPALGLFLAIPKRIGTGWIIAAALLTAAPAAFCAIWFGSALYVLPVLAAVGLTLLCVKFEGRTQAPAWLFIVLALLAVGAVAGFGWWKYTRDAAFAARIGAVIHANANAAPGAVGSGIGLMRQANLIGPSLATVQVGSSLIYAGDYVTVHAANMALSVILNLGWIPFIILCVCHLLIGVSLILMARECRGSGVRYAILSVGIFWLLAFLLGCAGDVLMYSSALTLPLAGIYQQVILHALFLGMCCGMFASDVHIRCQKPETPEKAAEEPAAEPAEAPAAN